MAYKNREFTYYQSKGCQEAFELADSLSRDEFVKLDYHNKFVVHLYEKHNSHYFASYLIGECSDSKLNGCLHRQYDLFEKRKKEYSLSNLSSYYDNDIYNMDWFRHTKNLTLEITDNIVSKRLYSAVKSLEERVRKRIWNIQYYEKNIMEKYDKMEIQLNRFIDYIEYNYPYEYSPITLFHFLKDYTGHVKNEIFDNLITLTDSSKKAYLNKVLYRLKEHYEYLDQDILTHVEFYSNKYNLNDLDMFRPNSNNLLSSILCEEPNNLGNDLKRREFKTDQFPSDAEKIQYLFWQYAIKIHCDILFEFIELQLIELNPNANAKPETKPSITKVDTTLTVPQLAYLFRALVDEKLITPKQKTDLFKAVTEIFKTKATESISPDSFKNKYDAPESKAIEFWQEKFTHLMQRAKKEKSKEN